MISAIGGYTARRSMYLTSVAHLRFMPVVPVSTLLFRDVVDGPRYAALSAAVVHARDGLDGKVVWNISQPASIGAVPELLRSMVAYALGAGIDTRWLAVQPHAQFALITNRIRARLFGDEGDGGELSEREHDEYERSVEPAALELCFLVKRGDLVFLHGPETVGLVPELKRAGARVVWRSHIGSESPSVRAVEAWDFLARYLAGADAYVLARAQAVPDQLRGGRVEVIPPSLDPLSPKNNFMTRAEAGSVLINAGILSGYAAAVPLYLDPAGGLRLLSRSSQVVQMEPVPPTKPLVVEVSRWDPLKDLVGVIEAFAGLVAESTQSHLVIAGPDLTAMPGDSEGADVFRRTVAAWERLAEPVRRRVHIALLPVDDPDENAAIVNALQRWASVIVQKSFGEGAGLAATEGMWKARPVVATRSGCIADRIEDGKSGVLLDDPGDLVGFAAAVSRLLNEPDEAKEMGRAAMNAVKENYLADLELRRYGDLLSRLAG